MLRLIQAKTRVKYLIHHSPINHDVDMLSQHQLNLIAYKYGENSLITSKMVLLVLFGGGGEGSRKPPKILKQRVGVDFLKMSEF